MTPLVLVFVVTINNLFHDGAWSCYAQNMMLVAQSLRIGSWWIGFATILGIHRRMIKKLGVPDEHHIAAALVFGYPKTDIPKPPIRKVGSDVVKWIE